MSEKAGELYIPLELKDSFTEKLNMAKSTVLGFGKLAMGAALGVGAAFVGAGIAGTKAFVEFEGQMNEVFTLMPDITNKAMKGMTKDTKDFAKEFGVLPEKVVPALYQSISAGVPPDNVFSFLEVAQKAAVGGVTELETAVDGISSVVNAYGSDVISAGKASDLMFSAVKKGKTTFGELSQSLFQVIPTASAMGVKFEDVTAAIAGMTAQGTPTSVATTQMRQMLNELSKAGGETSKTFEKIAGKSFKEFIAEGNNTQDALKLLEKHAKDSGVGINDLFGSVEAGAAALQLTGKGTDTFSANLKEMENSAGATDAAYGRMEEGVGRSLDKLKAAGKVMLLDFGEKLAPVLASFADTVQKNMPAIQATIEKAFSAISNAISIAREAWAFFIDGIKGTGDPEAVVGTWSYYFYKFGETVTIVKDALTSAWAVIGPILLALAQAVLSVFAGIDWGSLGKQLSEAWGTLKLALEPVLPLLKVLAVVLGGVLAVAIGIFLGLWKGVVSAIGGIAKMLSGAITAFSGFVGIIIGLFTGDMQQVKKSWEALWTGVKTFFSGIKDAVIGLVGGFVTGIIDFFKTLYNTLVGHSIIPDLVNGIIAWFQKLPETLLVVWSNIKAKAIESWNSIKSSIITKASEIKTEAVAKISSIVSALADLPGKAYSWGKSIFQELWDGMKSTFSRLKEWFNANVVPLINKLNPWARHSPSLVDNVRSGIRAIEQAYSGMSIQVPSLMSASSGSSSSYNKVSNNVYNVTIEADNIKSLQDMIRLFEQLPQAQRSL